MNILQAAETIVSFSPETGEILAEAPLAVAAEVHEKTERAREAQREWGRMPLRARLDLLRKLHSVLVQEADAVAWTLSAETGRPLQESLGAEVLPMMHSLEFLFREAPSLLKPMRLRARGTIAYAEPYGVIGIIGAWNYPLFLNLVPICQALAAGNTVVWKPSELAVFSAQTIARLLEAAGVPCGVVEIAFGASETGQALTQADCDKYVFTGSVPTGRAILAELAQSGKPSVMELSGNDAFLVCADAALETAARAAVWGRVSNAGQSCVAPQRFYVEQTVYEPFLQAMKRHIAALRPHELTPLRTATARQRCHRLVREAVEQGARLLYGGGFDPEQPGFFYTPTLLADCTDTMAVMQEDLFAPVLAVCPVRNEHEAVRRANGNPLALGASVWTEDRKRGAELAAQLHVGLVSVNEILLDAAHPAIPFGGVGASGFGKQRGAQGLEEFVVRKVVVRHAAEGTRRHLFPYLPAATDLLTAAAHLRGTQGWRTLPDLIRAAVAWQRQERIFKQTGAKKP